jgi:hypothetical protein
MEYLILSVGAYSDYSPTYFVGGKKITQKELTNKAEEIGTKMWNEWILDKKPEYSCGPDEDEFIEKLTEWIVHEGYKPIPTNIPEVNVYYDVPGKPTI